MIDNFDPNIPIKNGRVIKTKIGPSPGLSKHSLVGFNYVQGYEFNQIP